MTTKTDTEQEREALLPCPFCNSTDISLHSGLHIAHVECGGCGAQGPTVIIQAGQPARSAWNRQAALDSPEVQALREDAERLDWIQEQAKQSRSGVGFDWRPAHTEEGQVLEMKGWRFMRHHFLGDRKPNIREAIDAAMEKQK